MGTASHLKAAVENAPPGSAFVLADGVHDVSSGGITINRDVNISAANVGRAVLDGGNANRVLSISSGMVVLTGLKILKGQGTVSTQQLQTFALLKVASKMLPDVSALFSTGLC